MTGIWGVERTQIPFDDPRLHKLARNLAPAFLRMGGSLQDHAFYNFSGAGVTEPLPVPANYLQLYLNESQFDSVVDLCDAAGLDLVFGLNAAVGRQTPPGLWNFTNVRLLLDRAARLRQRLPVVELGNEVNVFNCSGANNTANMSASQLAHQYRTLSSYLSATLPDTQLWGSDSSITGDVVGQCHSYYGDDLFGFNRDFFRDAASPQAAMSAYTWHYYSQSSRNTSSTAALVLSDEFQGRIRGFEAQARAVRDALAPELPIVLGETASFWAGGVANVSNRFASGFWYLPQLGFLARQGYWAHIRQDLAGGDYGLVDLVLDAAGVVTGFAPNPDYFTHALWQRLVAGAVLDAAVVAPARGLRAFAFCSAPRAAAGAGGVTLVLVNFNATAAITVDFALAGGGSVPAMRNEYVMTAGPGGLASSVAVLNGEALALASGSLDLPAMPPRVVASSTPLQLPALSYAFVTLPGASAPACATSGP